MCCELLTQQSVLLPKHLPNIYKHIGCVYITTFNFFCQDILLIFVNAFFMANTLIMDRSYLKKICAVGAAMIENGAEISRAEDSLRRMLFARGLSASVFCLNSLMIVVCDDEVFVSRIDKNELNLSEIDRLNAVSRELCGETCVHRDESKYSLPFRCVCVLLATGAFSVYFGGGLADAIISGIVGLIIMKMPDLNVGSFANVLMQSFVAGVLAYVPLFFGVNCSVEKIMIGTVMLLVPGITIGNSVRDIMYCDTLSGIIEFTQSVFTALAIAFGFSLAVIIVNG